MRKRISNRIFLVLPVESWLYQQVATAYDALKADPARAITPEQVRARLAVEHSKNR